MARLAASGGAYVVLVGKLDGKKPLERHRLRWEDNIKMHV